MPELRPSPVGASPGDSHAGGSRRRGRTLLRGAAVALLVLGLGACGGGTGPDGGGDPEVTVTPSASTLDALDATVDLSASGTSSSGQSVSDGDLDWSSTEGAVASVNGVGLVTARSNGVTRVVASLPDGAAADTAEVTVEQEIARVRVSPESAELPSLGDTAHFSATAEDANGNAVAEVSFTWSSSDSLVVTVDETGVATARDTGEADVVAAAPQDSSGSARVEVAQPDPQIDGISPTTLQEGGTATITGSEFGSDPSVVQVLVAGSDAPVISVSESEIEVNVPLYDCRPPREVGVQVVVDDDSSGVATADLQPDEETVELAAGERRVISRPEDGFCVQLGASDEGQTYLVGLQSVTDAVGLTAASLSLEAGDGTAAGAGDAPGRAPGVPDRAQRVPGGGGGTARAGLLGAPAGRPLLEARLRRWEREHLGPHLASSIPRRWGTDGPPEGYREQAAGRPPLAAEIGSNPSEGDTIPIRVPDVTAGNACSAFQEITTVVQKVGARGIWLEDVTNPTDGFTSGDFQTFSDQFDDPVYGVDTDYFGDPTDIDSNSRIAMVVTKELNEFGGILGFVFAGDLFPRQSDSGTSCASSDEGEIAYMLAPDPDGTFGDTVTVASMRRTYPKLVAHEFTHIIQFGRRLECSACDFPVIWITEGQATLAEEVAGHAVTGRTTGQNYGFDVAFNANDADDSDWYQDRFVDMAVYYGFEGRDEKVEAAPHQCSWQVNDWAGPCIGGRGVYGVPSTLLRWINDHLGPSHPGGEQGLQREITGNDDLGFANLEEVTGESMKSLLADWGPMLWTDDRVGGVPARLTLPSWDLVDIFQNLVTPARLEPEVRGFSDFSDSFSVNAGSAIYYLVDGTGRPPVSMRARSVGGSLLPSHMQMWVVRTR